MKRTRSWTPFPGRASALDYAADALKKHWSRLHRGDQEPWPGVPYVTRLCRDHPQVARSIAGFDGDFAALSQRTLEAWRCYHRGDFEEAVGIAARLGWVGFPAAAKATLIYATYLADRAQRLALLEDLIERAEAAAAALPELASAHYAYAAALGRHSQNTSVVEALARGSAGRIRDALQRTLDLAGDHAEAHVAFGTYHAEIIDKVGMLIGRVTYGASADEAVRHYDRALALHPQSTIARVEYAQGLLSMFGSSRADRAAGLLGEAARLEPRDAMEWLDIERAKVRLDLLRGERS